MTPDPPRVVLQRGRDHPARGRHPWVFSGAIARIEGQAADGDEVAVHASDGSFVARGLYNSRSQIRVRLYAWDPAARLDEAFFAGRLDRALEARRLGRSGDPARA